MGEQSYTKVELLTFGNGFPNKGLFCKKCKTFIPQFEDLNEQDERRVKSIANTQPSLAMSELMYFTGCSHRFAKIWVLHEGKPEVIYDYPCPFCEEKLRTSEAKQCRFCLRDWHDENNLTFLK